MKRGVVKRCMLGGMLALGTLFVGINQAVASCAVGGQIVERVLSYDKGVGSYVYLRPAGAVTSTVSYYFYTDSDKIVASATASETNRTQVNVLGSIANCPTSGTVRFIGDAVYLYMIN